MRPHAAQVETALDAFGTSQRVIGATSTNRAVLVRVTTLQTGKAQLTLVPKAAVSLAPGVYTVRAEVGGAAVLTQGFVVVR